MTSSNGKIPAGFFLINLIKNGKLINFSNEEVTSFEMSPDKMAKAEYSFNIKILKILKQDAYEAYLKMKGGNVNPSKSPLSPRHIFTTSPRSKLPTSPRNMFPTSPRNVFGTSPRNVFPAANSPRTVFPAASSPRNMFAAKYSEKDMDENSRKR